MCTYATEATADLLRLGLSRDSAGSNRKQSPAVGSVAGSGSADPSYPSPPVAEPPELDSALRGARLHPRRWQRGEQAGAALRSVAEKRNARAKPSGGTHRLAVVQGPLVLAGALEAAAPPLPFAAARRGPAAREDGGDGAGALPAPAQCRAHARASAARNRRRRGGPAGAGSAFPAAAPGRVRAPLRSRQCAESCRLRESPESALQHRPGYREERRRGRRLPFFSSMSVPAEPPRRRHAPPSSSPQAAGGGSGGRARGRGGERGRARRRSASSIQRPPEPAPAPPRNREPLAGAEPGAGVCVCERCQRRAGFVGWEPERGRSPPPAPRALGDLPCGSRRSWCRSPGGGLERAWRGRRLCASLAGRGRASSSVSWGHCLPSGTTFILQNAKSLCFICQRNPSCRCFPIAEHYTHPMHRRWHRGGPMPLLGQRGECPPALQISTFSDLKPLSDISHHPLYAVGSWALVLSKAELTL